MTVFRFFSLFILMFCLGSDIEAQVPSQPYILDMVQNNPGEPLTNSLFNDPEYLKKQGYNGQIIADFTFVHAALTFDKFDPNIFPKGSKERDWVLKAVKKVKENIKKAHQAGIKIYYFTDIIVLPKKLVELYRNEICDQNGQISFEKTKTIEIHRAMLRELFETFPEIDGLVIRTGETYLNNVPYHTGNNPITNGEISHIKLINLLREEVCVRRNKKLFYRTWSFGGMHENPDYYLNVTNKIEIHPNLVFSIKHTKGDYHRTFDFNPTITIGKHPQIVEVQCQREYQGKGAYPNYVMEGVINGFEEYKTNTPQAGFSGLKELRSHPNFRGVWSWSRGGGWVGPYIKNEFWCRINAYVINKWTADSRLSELDVFNQFMKENGIFGKSATNFRKLCLLSAKAVLRGQYSASLPFKNDWAWWMRDEFLSGIDRDSKPFSSEGPLADAFTFYHSQGVLQNAVDEKFEAVAIWGEIVNLSRHITIADKKDEKYLRISSQYGLLLHQIIAEGWNIMASGFAGDRTGKYDTVKISTAIKNYDYYWAQYNKLKADNPDCATLYKPYAFAYIAPNYHEVKGMQASVDKYRKMVSQKKYVNDN